MTDPAYDALFGSSEPPRPRAPKKPLDLIAQYESGDRNVPNYRFDRTHTAQGHFQITNTNWRSYGPRAGVNLSEHPSAMAAPREIQERVADLMFQEQGYRPWAPYNAGLRAALQRGEGGQQQKPNPYDALFEKTPQRAESGPVTAPTSGTTPKTATPPTETSVTPEGAPQMASQPRDLTTNDAAWHFGMNPSEAQRMSRRQRRVLSEAVLEDERKRGSGTQITPPTLGYQNQMRQRAGLPPLKFNVAPTFNLGTVSLPGGDPEQAVSPYYQPESGSIENLSPLRVPEIQTRKNTFRFQPTAEDRARLEIRQRLEGDPNTFGAEYEAHLLRSRALDSPRMREDFLNLKLQQEIAKKGGGNAAGGGSAINVLVGEEVERGRQARVAKMGRAEYLAQWPKSFATGITDTVATGLKSIAVLNKKMDQLTFDRYKKETTDLPAYRLGQAIQTEARKILGSDADLEPDLLVGQAPAAIGQVFGMLFGGAAAKSPRLMVIALGTGLTTGDAYEEARANGATDEQAVNLALLAGGLLGPTELLGMEGAINAIKSGARRATWRATLKEAAATGSKEMAQNAVQEIIQEGGQGILTGKPRTEKELLTAAALGALATGVTTTPLTLYTSRPQKPPREIEEAPDITVNPDEAPITLPEGPRVIEAEPPSAIAAQMDALTNRRGNRLAVLVPKGTPAPTKIPKGYRTTRTSEGVMIHPTELASDDVQELVDSGETWRLLGHANPDGPTASRIVIARSGIEAQGGITPGSELMSSYVEPGQEQNAIDEMRAQFGPYQPTFEVGGTETAAAVVNDRATATATQGTPVELTEENGRLVVRHKTPSGLVERTFRRGERREALQYAEELTDAETARQNAAAQTPSPIGWRPGMPQPSRKPPGAEAIAEPTAEPAVEPAPTAPSRFEGLSNEQIEQYIENTRRQAERQISKLSQRPPKGTPAAQRQTRPRRIDRIRGRSHQRITEAQLELDQRRAGRGDIPSFESWLENQAGGTAGGIRVDSLNDQELAQYQRQYDQQFYGGTPHHSKFQRRRARGPRKGQFAPGKVEVSPVGDTTATEQQTQPAKLMPWELPQTTPENAQQQQEAAPEGQLFATSRVTAREPTADEQAALREPTIEVKPMEKQNALRSYLGNKMTMARAKAFDIIPTSWRDKFTRVVDVFGGSGIHGWQIGKALGKPIHYNELDPDVFSFQQLASNNEGQEEIRRIWNPMLDEIARIRQQHPEGGTEAHRLVSQWWNDTAKRLRRADASPAEKGARVLLENSLGTMGGTQSLIGADHKWKKDIGSLGDVSALLDKHRLNAQMWQSTSNERAEDLLPKTKPGDLVVLDPPYASTKGYAVGNEHGSVNGAVNFIENHIQPAAARGVSILYTNSAHLPIVEALRRAGLEVRIERVQTQTRAGQSGAYRYEVTAWTPDVSPPRPSSPDVLRGVIAQDATAGQRDLSGMTGEQLWTTLISAFEAGQAGPTVSITEVRRDPIEQARRDLTIERDQLIREAASIIAKEQHYSVKGDPIPMESVLTRAIDRTNGIRLELLRRIESQTDRETLEKEFPEMTQADVLAQAEQAAPIERPATPEEPDTGYQPMEGDDVEWTGEDGKILIGKVLKILPSGSIRVRVSGRGVAERKQRLPPTTQFRPHAKEVKARKPVGKPKLNTAVDSLEVAIRSLGGIRDDGSGELETLKQSGKAGLVTKDGRSAEDLAMALAEMGYGHGVWWEGSLRQGDASFTGVNADQFIQAAIDDASGSGKHYSSEFEQDFSAEEEAYWRSQMQAAEEGQFDASKEVIESELGSELLGEIADGNATAQTYQQLREFADEAGLEASVTDELIHLAESESPESTPARDREIPGSPSAATTPEGNPLTDRRGARRPATAEVFTDEQRAEVQAMLAAADPGDLDAMKAMLANARARVSDAYVDEEGTLHDESGQPLFRRRLRNEQAPADVVEAGKRYGEMASEMINLNLRIGDAGGQVRPLPKEQVDILWQQHRALLRKLMETENFIISRGYKVNMLGEVAKPDDRFPAGLKTRSITERLKDFITGEGPLFRRQLELGPRAEEIKAELDKIDAELEKAATSGRKAKRLQDEKKKLLAELGQLAINAKPGPAPEPRTVDNAFFSQLYRTVEAKMPNRASVDQIRQIIQSPQNQVKQDEVTWTGFDDFLSRQQAGKTIEKATVLDFLRANAVQIREQVKSPGANTDYRDEQMTLPDLTQGQADRGWSHTAIEPEEGDVVDEDTQEFVFNHDSLPIEITGSNDAGWFVRWTEAWAEEHDEDAEIANVGSITQAKLEAYTAYREAFEAEREQFGDMEAQYDRYVLPGPALIYEEQVFMADLEPKATRDERHARRQRLTQWREELAATMTRLEREYNLSGIFERNTADAIATIGNEKAERDAATYREAYAEYLALGQELRRIPSLDPKFESQHWSEENVIAHSRTTVRNDSDGKEGLLIEEIQSDLHQKAHEEQKDLREQLAVKYNVEPDQVESKANDLEKRVLALRGYADLKLAEDINARSFAIHDEQMKLMERNRADNTDISDEEHNRNAKRLTELDREFADVEKLRNEAQAGPPRAPLSRTWHEFVMRRLVRKAVERGYDRIYWTTGRQQIDRWQEAMRQNVRAIRWYKTEQTGFKVGDAKTTKTITVAVIQPIPMDETKVVEPMRIPLRGSTQIQGREVTLDEVVGRQIAKQIREGAMEGGTITGDNLTIGGEGMTHFYDQMLPSFMRRFGGKFGAKVGQVALRGDSLPDDLVATPEGNAWVITSTTNPSYKTTVTRSSGATAEQVIEKLRNYNAHTVHYMDITPAMANSVLEGQPLFRRGGKESKAPPTGRVGNTITIDTAARDALERAGIMPPGADGVTVRPALAVIYANRLQAAAKTGPEDAAILRRTARQMIAAANATEGASVIIATPEAMRHERFHEASDVGVSLRNRHARFDELTSHTSFKTARTKLIAAGYKDNDGELVEETAAHIAEGEYRTLGLTRKQALDWMQLWFVSFAEKNGNVTLKQFREMANEAQEALAAAINETATERTSQRTDEDVQSVQRGRETRAGPSLTPALAKGPTADIAQEPRFLGGKFHSQLYRILVQKMPGKATVAQIRQIVQQPQNGIKADEVKWSGLEEFLAGKDTVTRQELLDFLMIDRLGISERQFGETQTDDETMETEAYADPVLGAEIQALKQWGLIFTVDPGDPTHVAFFVDDPENDADGELLSLEEIPDALSGPNNRGKRAQKAAKGVADSYEQWLRERHAEAAAKYGRYTVPGESNRYREIVFTLPPRTETNELGPMGWATAGGMERAGSNNFTTVHWKGVVNPIAHTRVDDRTTVDGERMLFLNEVQSDWHQKGRKQGYRGEPITRLPEGLKFEHVEYPDGTSGVHVVNQHGAVIAHGSTEAAALTAYTQSEGGRFLEAPPPAPFQKTWHEFVMRRMLAEAVEGGYQYLGWATGEQASDLYDLSKQIDEIRATKSGPDTYVVKAFKDGKELIDRHNETASSLVDLVGKDLAEKIVASAKETDPHTANFDGWASFKGLDLKVGGTGMKGFYDKIIPDYMRRLAKKWGSTVEDVNIGPAPPRSAEEIAREIATDRVGPAHSDSDAADGMMARLNDGMTYEAAAEQLRASAVSWDRDNTDGNMREQAAHLLRDIDAAIKDEKHRQRPHLDTKLAQQNLERIMNEADIAGPDHDDRQMAASRILGAITGEIDAPVSVEDALRKEEQYGDREIAAQIRSELAMAQARTKDTRMVHAVKITPQMRESLLADSQPLFRRRPKETETQYEKRTKTALDRLAALAQQRGQQVKQQPVAEKPVSTETPKPATPTLRAVPPRPAPSGEGRTAERSFPKTAEAMGYRGGTDRDYSVLTNAEALQRAEAKLMRLGAGEAAADLARNDNPGAEDNAMGILLMQRFERTGQISRAVAVASDLAKKLTKAGQFVQATSIITRLSPEGVLLHAQKILKPGRTLTNGQAQTIVQQAREIAEAERLVAEIQRQRPDIFGPNGEILPRPTTRGQQSGRTTTRTRRGAKARIGKLTDRLASLEQEARARMEARKAAAEAQLAKAPPKSQRGAAASPPGIAADLADLVIIGTAKLARTGITRAVWLAEMAREAPGLSRRDLGRLYREASARYEQERQQFQRESRMRGAERVARGERGAIEGPPTPPELRQQGPLSPAEYNRIINERLDAQTRARRARTELNRTFRDLNAGRAVKIGRTVRDVWGLTRALITSVDISAGGRQGKMGLVSHPKAWLTGFARQFRAFSNAEYERMISQMQLDPDYKYAVRFGLELTSIASTETSGLAAKEEVFQTELADKLPWLRMSQQAYNTMLDQLRFGWLKANLEMYRRAGIDLENPDLRDQFKKDISLINKFTGRGGDRRLRAVAPTANAFAFSIRFWASRLEVMVMPLNPRMWGMTDNPYSRQARIDAWKTLFGFYGLVSLQMMLALALGADGEDIWNIDSPDFLKVRFGNVHVDFSAGMQSHFRVAARLAKSFYMREWQSDKPRKTPTEIIGKYLRSKEEPNVALIHDLFFSDKKDTEHGLRGTDYAGNPVYLFGEPGKGRLNRAATSAIVQRMLPIVLQDALEGYKEGLGLKELGFAWIGSTLGEGVTTYSPGYSEKKETFPMQSELDRMKIEINPPKRIKPGKHDKFKAESEQEYNERRRTEAEAIKDHLRRLEGMTFYQRLPDRDKEAEIRATIKAARESVRWQQPAAKRKEQAAAAP